MPTLRSKHRHLKDQAPMNHDIILRAIASLALNTRRVTGLCFLASALLVVGCVATTEDKASPKMSTAEKRVTAELAKITKGMSKDEVKAVLGRPSNSERAGCWQYYVNRRLEKGSVSTTGTTLAEVKHGAFTGGTVATPGVTVPVDVAKFDAVTLVYFSRDRVKKLRFIQPGLGGYCLTLIK
jgi:hypothetical protein